MKNARVGLLAMLIAMVWDEAQATRLEFLATHPRLSAFMVRHPLLGEPGLQSILGVFITVLVMVVLTPVVLSFVNNAQTLANLTATQETIWNLIPLFWVLAIVLVIVFGVIIASRGK